MRVGRSKTLILMDPYSSVVCIYGGVREGDILSYKAIRAEKGRESQFCLFFLFGHPSLVVVGLLLLLSSM